MPREEKPGFAAALCYIPRAFNDMPQTVVNTGSYVLSHLEQMAAIQ